VAGPEASVGERPAVPLGPQPHAAVEVPCAQRASGEGGRGARGGREKQQKHDELQMRARASLCVQQQTKPCAKMQEQSAVAPLPVK
jgi:hypothetical protein